MNRFKNTRLTFVNETRDTLDSSSSSETPDSGLGDSLDVVSQDLSVSLSTSLSETCARQRARSDEGRVRVVEGVRVDMLTFSTFTSTGHCCRVVCWESVLRVELKVRS
jgi:hypothetical protein